MQTEAITVTPTWTQATAGLVSFQNVSGMPIKMAYGTEPSTDTVPTEVLQPGDGRIVPAETTVWLRCHEATVVIAGS